ATVVHQDDVIEAMSSHVGKMDPSSRIIEEDIWKLFDVMHPRYELWRCKSLFAETFKPQKMLCFGHEHVGPAVACQIDESHVGIIEVEVGEFLVCLESLPGFVGSGFVKSG